MADIHRVRVSLTGFIGGPGVSTFYSLNGAALQAPLQDFYFRIRNSFPVDVQIKVEASGDTLDPATGLLTGTWIGADTAIVQGSSSGGYSAPVGMLARWTTAVVADGHRVRGRTFLVPSGGDQFDATGTPAPAALGIIAVAAAGFVVAASPNFIVWHRPAKARAATATSPARAAHAGLACGVTGSSAGPKAAVLRSRRD